MFLRVKGIIVPLEVLSKFKDIPTENFQLQDTYINSDNILTIYSLEEGMEYSDKGLLTSITLVNNDFVLVENPIGEVLAQLDIQEGV